MNKIELIEKIKAVNDGKYIAVITARVSNFKNSSRQNLTGVWNSTGFHIIKADSISSSYIHTNEPILDIEDLKKACENVLSLMIGTYGVYHKQHKGSASNRDREDDQLIFLPAHLGYYPFEEVINFHNYSTNE